MAPATRRSRQVIRLVTLLKILKEGGRPSVYELAARFRTRRETIYRDLRALQEVGYPIVGDAEGRLSHPGLAPEVRATVPPRNVGRSNFINLSIAGQLRSRIGRVERSAVIADIAGRPTKPPPSLRLSVAVDPRNLTP